MFKFRIILTIVLFVIGGLVFLFSSEERKAVISAVEEVRLGAPVVLATESKFTREIIEEGEKLDFDVEIEYDAEKDACSDDEIIQKGIMGKRTKEIEIIYYDGEEYDREIVAIHKEDPQTEIVKKGLKKIYKSMQTGSGTINYWCKLGDFSATAYDPTCLGCNSTTAIGMKAGFGVVAVDRKVIPLGSQLYITGYGKAIAGDTGGGIRGREVDLGFDSIGSWWGRRTVEVYLL